MLAPLRNPTFHPIILRSLLFITNFSRLPRIYLHYYSLLHHFCVTCIIYCNLMRSLNCLTSWIMSIISSFVYLKKKHSGLIARSTRFWVLWLATTSRYVTVMERICHVMLVWLRGHYAAINCNLAKANGPRKTKLNVSEVLRCRRFSFAEGKDRWWT